MDKWARVAREIAADAKADVERYEGMPFNGRTVAKVTGEQNAMINTLARIVADMADHINQQQRQIDALTKRMRTVRHEGCRSCGLPLTDGYSNDGECVVCAERRLNPHAEEETS